MHNSVEEGRCHGARCMVCGRREGARREAGGGGSVSRLYSLVFCLILLASKKARHKKSEKCMTFCDVIKEVSPPGTCI